MNEKRIKYPGLDAKPIPHKSRDLMLIRFGDLIEIREDGHTVFWFNPDDWPTLRDTINEIVGGEDGDKASD